MLGQWDTAGAQPPRRDVAERLSHWLPVREAITLDAAHRAIQALPGQWAAPRVRKAVGPALQQELQRVRATLVQAIRAAPAPRRRHAWASGTAPAPAAAAPDAQAAFAPVRERVVDLQRQMALQVDALRAHVRQQLATCSPALAQLAALDAVLEQMLGERTRKALAALPVLLERRCAQPGAAPAGDVQAWGRELQEVLLAELETRLEPVAGLMEAGSRQGGAAWGTVL